MPSGGINLGRCTFPKVISTLHRSAILTVFSSASRDGLEDVQHLLEILEVEFIRAEAQPLHVSQVFSRVDAQEGVVGVCVVHIHIMDVICRNKGYLQLPGDCRCLGNEPGLLFEFVVLDFDKETVLRRRYPCILSPPLAPLRSGY